MYRLDVLVIEIWPITTKNPEVEPHPDSSDDRLGRLGWENIVFYDVFCRRYLFKYDF